MQALKARIKGGLMMAACSIIGISLTWSNALGQATPDRDPLLDYGDAPDPTFATAGEYPTLLANDGARHALSGGLFLGASVDGEPDGQPTALATGDDLNVSDDEDGIVFVSVPTVGGSTNVTVTASTPGGLLSAWIDFNDDGDWADAAEKIFADVALAAGPNPLIFTVPITAVPASLTFARFRLSTQGGLAPAGLASDGEVEDYALEILAAKPVPEPGPLTLFAFGLAGLGFMRRRKLDT